MKALEVCSHVMVDTGHTGFITSINGEDYTICEAADGTGWTMKVEERQLGHVYKPMRHDFTNDEILAAWESTEPRKTCPAKVLAFGRTLLKGQPRG